MSRGGDGTALAGLHGFARALTTFVGCDSQQQATRQAEQELGPAQTRAARERCAAMTLGTASLALAAGLV